MEMLEIEVNLPDHLTVLPNEWNYDESVIKMRRLVVRWKNISTEILKELYIARQMLFASDRRTDLNLHTNVGRLT